MLSQHGLQHLAALLYTGTSLRCLRLDFCVGTAYAHSLARGLGRYSTLLSFILSFIFNLYFSCQLPPKP
jgi:hypothetical protein